MRLGSRTSVWARPSHLDDSKSTKQVDRTLDESASPRANLTIGIDFGTSNSCVAVWNSVKNKAKVIKVPLASCDTSKSKLLPSTVLFRALDQCVVGSEGQQLDASDGTSNNSLLVAYIKKILAIQNTNPPSSNEVGALLENERYFVDRKKVVMVYTSNHRQRQQALPATKIASLIIEKLKIAAEDYITRKAHKYFPSIQLTDVSTSDGREKIVIKGNSKRYFCNSVVLGIPASYSDEQCAATIAAAKLAGFEQVYLQVESTAAAMAYGLLGVGEKSIMVVDIGGGTTDVTLLYINDGRYTVLGVAGCEDCGGVNVDQLLRWHIINTVLKKENVDFKLSNAQLTLLDTICRKAKEELSTLTSTIVSIPVSILRQVDTEGPSSVHIVGDVVEVEVTRETFDNIVQPLSDKVTQVVTEAITAWVKKAPADRRTLQEVVLVGGSSRVPAFRRAIRLALESTNVIESSHPEGAAPAASSTSKSFEFCTSVDADQAVVQGLCIQGAVLSGVNTGLLKDILMMDMLPQNIGVMTWCVDQPSGREIRSFQVILAKGDRIPATKRRRFPIDAECRRMRRVSLDIYEEVEGEVNVGSEEHSPSLILLSGKWYRLMGTYNVPIATTEGRLGVVGEYADIEMTLNAEGELYFDAVASAGDSGSITSNSDSNDINWEIVFLMVSIAILIVLYVFVQVYLPRPIVSRSGIPMTPETNSMIQKCDNSINCEF